MKKIENGEINALQVNETKTVHSNAKEYGIDHNTTVNQKKVTEIQDKIKEENFESDILTKDENQNDNLNDDIVYEEEIKSKELEQDKENDEPRHENVIDDMEFDDEIKEDL